tara:strand:- start:48 stop:317 length:270 start_codon:yes stop_codon:yes gene_type:complete
LRFLFQLLEALQDLLDLPLSRGITPAYKDTSVSGKNDNNHYGLKGILLASSPGVMSRSFGFLLGFSLISGHGNSPKFSVKDISGQVAFT